MSVLGSIIELKLRYKGIIKERLNLTLSAMNNHLQNIRQEIYEAIRTESSCYDTEHIEPFRIIRDIKIKNALRASVFGLLKAEPEPKLLEQYVDVGTTWDCYKYGVERCYIWCGEPTSYAPYDDIIDGLYNELDLLIRISDEAWSRVTHRNKDNNIFDEFKIAKDNALREYIDKTINYLKYSCQIPVNHWEQYHICRNLIIYKNATLCQNNTPIPSLTHLCLEALGNKPLPFTNECIVKYI